MKKWKIFIRHIIWLNPNYEKWNLISAMNIILE